MGIMGLTSDATRVRAAQLDSDWSAIGVDVSRCPAMASNTSVGIAFDLDFTNWKIFLQNIPPLSDSDANAQIDAFQLKLSEWQQKVEQLGCPVSGTPVKPPAPSTTVDSVTGLVKLLALAAIVIAIVYAVGPALRAARRNPRRLRG